MLRQFVIGVLPGGQAQRCFYCLCSALCLLLGKGAPAQPAHEPAAIYLYYPRAKSTVALNVFFNRKLVARIRYGQRLVYQTTYRGSLMVTVAQEVTHAEPRTLAKNTRTVGIQPGGAYYFEVDGKGITFVPTPALGKEHFGHEADFLGAPVIIPVAAADSIPGPQPGR